LIRAILAILIATSAAAATLPGWQIQKAADVSGGFLSSLAIDSGGRLYYTTTNGRIVRVGDGVVATVATEAAGNSGLLGIALQDDRTAVVHYTRPNQTYDVVSRIDLVTGAETIIHEFAGDIVLPERGVSPEHHGGNLVVTPGGTIYLGIGDYGLVQIAAMTDWNAGKIFRIDPDGSVHQIARGFRNPFDVAWDPDKKQLVVPDNGDVVDDEINVIQADGGFYGWPQTMGSEPAVEGAIGPSFVFPRIVAPTGIVRLSGRNSMLKHGYLMSSFVAGALFYFDDPAAPNPLPIIEGNVGPIIDVTESLSGDLYFATGTAVYKLIPPMRGDCNGDGAITTADIATIASRVGSPAEGAWPCDANDDGLINAVDESVLWRTLTNRLPSVRRR